MDPRERLFSPVKNGYVDSKKCFLCGVSLIPGNKTKEHVIPRWVQQKFNLWDEKLTLLNGTKIPYRHLTIPCCQPCNSLALNQLEITVRSAVEGGYPTVCNLNPNILALWLSKLFYGLLYRELSLPFDRRDPKKGTIVEEQLIEIYQSLHYFLQSARVAMSYLFVPHSVFVFECQESQIAEKNWDLVTNLPGCFIAVRLGQIGIIACLQDNATHSNSKLTSELYKMVGGALHPMQFRELVAMVAYKNTLFNRNPSYIYVGTDPIIVSTTQGCDLSGSPLMKEWDDKIYALFLGRYLDIEPSSLIVGDRVKSWLRDNDGNFDPMDLDETV